MLRCAAKGLGVSGGTLVVCRMQAFKQILAWQRAHAVAIAVHRLSATFSRAGHAPLRSQLTRAADSIATNIVEGCGSATQKELARYLDISIKSANETEH